MENTSIVYDAPIDILENLKSHIPGTIEQYDEDSSALHVDAGVGSGSIRYMNLNQGLQVMDFNLSVHKDTEITIGNAGTESFHFLYCLQGNCEHQFYNYDTSYSIDTFQTAVIYSDLGVRSRLSISKGNPLILSIIRVNKTSYFNTINKNGNRFSKTTSNLLGAIDSMSKHFHSGGYNVKIAEQLHLIMNEESEHDIAKRLARKGRYHIVLAKHIEQFLSEIGGDTDTGSLLKTELKKIAEIGDYIRQKPDLPHSINSLSFHSGLSPAKLQEGFKFVFQKTVSNFVRNVRLEKAENLLLTTDLSISEIVYSVGLTSRSYFCKIFKKKYKYTPKEFKAKFA